MWAYVAQCLAWSGLWLAAGAAAAQIACDIHSACRHHLGRHHHDHT